jgi:predicted amidophosphoribosyltransferase
MYFFYRSFLDKICPRSCISCPAELLGSEDQLCSTCSDRLLASIIAKRETIPSCDSAEAWMDFDALQTYMHRIKFDSHPELAFYLGKAYALHTPCPLVDALVPVPLSAQRRRKRGYNQCEWICRGLSSVWGLPIWKDALIKSHRAAQAQQNKAQRAMHMMDAFAPGGPSLKAPAFSFGMTPGPRGPRSMPPAGPCELAGQAKSMREPWRQNKNPPP